MGHRSSRPRLPAASVLLLSMALGACAGKPPTPPLVLPQLVRPITELRPSTSATTEVLIPAAAFVVRGGLPGVFVLRDGRARFRMVRIGRLRGNRLQVLSGLTGNEILVLGDLTDVHDGSPIIVHRERVLKERKS
ncbi:MAG: hypothetical protein ACYDHM_05455 [Acidiferrobacterales bacterium]